MRAGVVPGKNGAGLRTHGCEFQFATYTFGVSPQDTYPRILLSSPGN
jgi:hypothetical protein